MVLVLVVVVLVLVVVVLLLLLLLVVVVVVVRVAMGRAVTLRCLVNLCTRGRETWSHLVTQFLCSPQVIHLKGNGLIDC